jgi:hypothetical protein
MIKQNNKLLKVNNKYITVINKALFTIANTVTTNSIKFNIAVSSPITIYFDTIPINVTGNTLTSLYATLPEIKNYNVIVQDDDLSKIKGLEIGVSNHSTIKNVIFDRISKLINCTTFIIHTNCDPILQTINISNITNLTILKLFVNYKTVDQSVLDKITTLTQLNLDRYQAKLNVTKLFQNNLNLIIVVINTNVINDTTGEVIIPENNTYVVFYISGAVTGNINNLKYSTELSSVRINSAGNIELDTTDFITTKLATLYTNLNSIVNIENLYNNVASVGDVYLVLIGTINGSISDILDSTSPRYNDTIHTKITTLTRYNNFYLNARGGTFSGNLHIFFNKIRITSYITYNLVSSPDNGQNLICDIGQFNISAINIQEVSITINWKYITLIGDCSIFQTSSNRTSILLTNLHSNSNITNIKYIAYPTTLDSISFQSNTISQIELDSLVNTVFERRNMYTVLTRKTMIINNNSTVISGTYQSPNVGTYTGNINNLTEDQINNLSNGLDYTGSGTNTPWTQKEKVWILVNLNISSTNSTKRYKWAITY